MQAEALFREINRGLEGDSRIKRMQVVLCTETCTLTGFTYSMNHQRLLDVLNQNFTSNLLPIGKDFIPLTDAEISFPGRERESAASIYVRKSGILFMAEATEHQTNESENGDKSRLYLAKPKSSLAAEIHIPSFTLRGQIYGHNLQKLLDVIDRADRFLPLTNVEICPALDNDVSQFDFVAVNRDKIIYVCEALGWAKASMPTAETIRSG